MIILNQPSKDLSTLATIVVLFSAKTTTSNNKPTTYQK